MRDDSRLKAPQSHSFVMCLQKQQSEVQLGIVHNDNGPFYGRHFDVLTGRKCTGVIDDIKNGSLSFIVLTGIVSASSVEREIIERITETMVSFSSTSAF